MDARRAIEHFHETPEFRDVQVDGGRYVHTWTVPQSSILLRDTRPGQQSGNYRVPQAQNSTRPNESFDDPEQVAPSSNLGARRDVRSRSVDALDPDYLRPDPPRPDMIQKPDGESNVDMADQHHNLGGQLLIKDDCLQATSDQQRYRTDPSSVSVPHHKYVPMSQKAMRSFTDKRTRSPVVCHGDSRTYTDAAHNNQKDERQTTGVESLASVKDKDCYVAMKACHVPDQREVTQCHSLPMTVEPCVPLSPSHQLYQKGTAPSGKVSETPKAYVEMASVQLDNSVAQTVPELHPDLQHKYVDMFSGQMSELGTTGPLPVAQDPDGYMAMGQNQQRQERSVDGSSVTDRPDFHNVRDSYVPMASSYQQRPPRMTAVTIIGDADGYLVMKPPNLQAMVQVPDQYVAMEQNPQQRSESTEHGQTYPNQSARGCVSMSTKLPVRTGRPSKGKLAPAHIAE